MDVNFFKLSHGKSGRGVPRIEDVIVADSCRLHVCIFNGLCSGLVVVLLKRYYCMCRLIPWPCPPVMPAGGESCVGVGKAALDRTATLPTLP